MAEPDLVVTGTPSGVGMAADPPRFLRAGDRMRVEIDGLGELENTIRAWLDRVRAQPGFKPLAAL